MDIQTTLNDQRSNLPVAFIILRDYLMENFRAKRAAGGRECVIRCPFCGDSKDPRSAHLYVGHNRQKGTISYHCFKCNTQGDVGLQFFRTLGIYDTQLVNSVLEYNQSKGGVINAEIHRGYQSRYSPIEIDPIIPIKDTEEYRKKLAYINRRIGGQLTFNDIAKYRIVLNLLDFLSINGITTYSRHISIMEQLSFGFVGFLSVDSTHVTMRRIVPENKVHESISKRYTNYTIHEKGTQIYCVREGINPMYPNSIIVAEGAFDILSLHYNFLCYTSNKIMFASCGKGVTPILEYLTRRKRLSLLNSQLHVFIDNDITPYDLASYKYAASSIELPCIIHRNVFPGEKDYGVPANKIRDFIVR